MDLTDKEIQEVSHIKSELKNFLHATADDIVFHELSTFAQKLVNDSDLNIGFKLLRFDINSQKLSGVIMFFSEQKTDKKLEFEIYATRDVSELENEMKQTIEACEPWRLTNPKLAKHETDLKEWCNRDEPYKPSILFDTERLINVFALVMLPVALVMIYKSLAHAMT